MPLLSRRDLSTDVSSFTRRQTRPRGQLSFAGPGSAKRMAPRCARPPRATSTRIGPSLETISLFLEGRALGFDMPAKTARLSVLQWAFAPETCQAHSPVKWLYQNVRWVRSSR